MSKLFGCRRSILALVGMFCCVLVTWKTGMDTSGAIAFIVTSIAGANAAQAVMGRKKETTSAD